MTAKELQSFFAQPYERSAWLGNLRTVFPRTDLFAQPQTCPVGDSRAESVCYLGNTAYFLPAHSGGLCLLALLNSEVFHAYARKVFVEKQNGWYEVQPEGLETFPIPEVPAAERTALVGLVERILASKRADGQAEPPSRGNASASDTVRAWEREIDDRVYRLYGLTKDEITIIEEGSQERSTSSVNA